MGLKELREASSDAPRWGTVTWDAGAEALADLCLVTDILCLSALLGCFFLSWRIIKLLPFLKLWQAVQYTVYAYFLSLNSESGTHHFRDEEMTAQGVESPC